MNTNRQSPQINPCVSRVSANVLVNTHTAYWPTHGLFLVSMLVNTWSILLPCIDIFICMECHHWGERSLWTNYLHGLKFIKNIARQDRQTFATGQSAFKTATLATEMTKNWVDSKYNSRRRICYISIYSIGRMLMAYWAICRLIISQILTNTISQLILRYASDVQTICRLTYHLTRSWLMFTYIDQ